jgi:oligopeptide/dipeptide ABC transporter ATP-binding protein
MTPLLQLTNINKHFRLSASFLAKLLAKRKDQYVRAVNGISLDLFDNETLGLVGESGSGKSTLGRVAIRLHAPTSGQVVYKGKDVSKTEGAHLRELRREMQIIYQNPYSSLNPRKTIRQIVGVSLGVCGINDPDQKEAEIKRLLKRVSLPERFIDAYPHQLSGGQRQRISIIRALAVRPRLIVADEPVSALDVSIQAQIIRLLEELQDEYHLTYLFIAHDLRVVHHISDRVAVMYLGKLVEIGKSEEIFKNPLHPYTLALMAAIPNLDNAGKEIKRKLLKGSVPSPLNPPGGCPFHTRCPSTIGNICQSNEPGWIKFSDTHSVACHRYNKLRK